MAERRDVLDLTNCYGSGGATNGLFVSRLLDEGKSEVRNDEWPTSAQTTDDLGSPVLRAVESGAERAVFELDGTLVHLTLGGGRMYAAVAGETQDRVSGTLESLRQKFPPPDPSSTHEVTVTFWTYSPHGPQPSWRTIAVPEWEEIELNYAEHTRGQLAHMMRDFQPAHGGQLLLWHGKAGTGKTFGLRALAWEWREWCDFHYIVDPDSFFGEHADYLMSVLLMPSHEMGHRSFVRAGGIVAMGDTEGEEERREKPWRVLILEDTGELLTPDAKTMIGQGLSRFLNVVDGLIGQGLRVLVLVTTNEPIRTLHPAVARPGRCAANIEFESLSVAEANDWLEGHEHDEEVDSPTPLASLYAILEGQDVVDVSQTAGFAGST
jgi:ATPase family associated with various cellular activities (AAA)